MDQSTFVNGVKVCIDLDSDSFRSGAHARFYDLGNGWGVKYFIEKGQRDENYNLQKQLANNSLAPNVGKKFQFSRSGMEMFGFFTEVVIPYEDYYDDVYSEESDDRIWNIGQELKAELEDVGLFVNDLHEGNVGWSERLNRWVVLDVSINNYNIEDEEYERHYWKDID